MDQETSQDQVPVKRRLSEDWLSVVIGLVLVALVALLGITSIPWPLLGVFK